MFRSRSHGVIPQHGWNVVQERREEFVIIKRKMRLSFNDVSDEDPISVLREGKDKL